MTSVEKPPDMRCRFCRPDGTCDQVAFRLEICGLAKLVAAVAPDCEHEK